MRSIGQDWFFPRIHLKYIHEFTQSVYLKSMFQRGFKTNPSVYGVQCFIRLQPRGSFQASDWLVLLEECLTLATREAYFISLGCCHIIRYIRLYLERGFSFWIDNDEAGLCDSDSGYYYIFHYIFVKLLAKAKELTL